MKRREALKSLLIVTGGVIVLPSCLQERTESSIHLNHIKIDANQEKQLAEIAEAIIPATASPGAKDTYAHRFALKMIDDCHPKEDQAKFIKGLNEVDRLSKERFHTTFLKSTPAQREQLIGELESRKAEDDLTAFYKLYKGLVIQGYMGSKYVMGNVLKFELVPGRYNGAAPVKKTYNQI